MNIYDAIIENSASTENEKLLARKAKARRSKTDSFQVQSGDETNAIEIAAMLGAYTERNNNGVFVHGSKKQVAIIKELLSLWQNMMPPVRDAVVFELLSALPDSAFCDRIESTKQKSFVKIPKAKLRPLTAMETAYAQSIAKQVLKET